ncbi:hypothetical protein ASS64_11165 [Erythrobacter sp. AP23]|nr:hypothetical protein ASS64_11165 [Erythrobacter sp. AP23]
MPAPNVVSGGDPALEVLPTECLEFALGFATVEEDVVDVPDQSVDESRLLRRSYGQSAKRPNVGRLYDRAVFQIAAVGMGFGVTWCRSGVMETR